MKRKVRAAVVLAAGSGSRMGHRPKSLLLIDGEPLIRRQLRALAGAGMTEVVVVLGHYADQIERVIRAENQRGVVCVRNADPEAGQTSSLRLGLQALPPETDAVLVALADQPLIDAEDIRDLLQAYDERPLASQMVQPTVDGLPGNPVVFSAQVRAHMLASEGLIGGQQWKAANPGLVHGWASTNSHYRQDVDTPEDIAALAALGYRLSWPADV